MGSTRRAFSKSFFFVGCFLAVLLLPISSWAACSGKSPNWTSTADYGSVSTCIANAAPGDTIVIYGNATWASPLVLTRGVKLVGSGNPIIVGSTTLFHWTPSSSALSGHDTLSISGFILDANNSNLAGSGLIRVSNSSVSYVNLIVRNNTIRNIAASGRGIYITGMVFGVAASNVFDRVAIVLGTYGSDYISWSSQAQEYGVARNFYFEDNTIFFSSSYPGGYSGWMQTGQGGRVVVRYNTWDYTNAAGPGEFWDIHGLQGPQPSSGVTGCQQYSSMVAEYYGNKIVNQLNAYRWMAHRGGWLAMFYNTLDGNTSPYNGVTQYFCNSCQATGNFNQKVENSYYWRNLANGNEKPATVYSPGAAPYGCTSDPIIENADFFNYNASFNGTSGIGCGTLANRPATCTPGVGYWATEQSCTDLTGMVGANPATPISGTLYKCVASNTWAPYFTPYTYPHPLRSGVTPSSGLAPPSGIRVIAPQ